ncbi:MAG: hypothetical protein IT379_39485 [Deltaproteobacteria bacterium]|nr:hypothetical protein [Deltaproteobacteria bacterium]
MTTRDPSEPGDAWDAFREYAALPPSSRSLKRLVRDGRSITTLKRMSLRWRWQARIDAEDGRPRSPQQTLAAVIPLHGGPAGGATTTVSTPDEASGSAGLTSASAANDDATRVRADVCTGDLLEVVETTLRRELGREGAYTANELQKIAATATDVARQRREREIADAHVEYDLSRLTDEEAATLRALCAKARIAKPQVA